MLLFGDHAAGTETSNRWETLSSIGSEKVPDPFVLQTRPKAKTEEDRIELWYLSPPNPQKVIVTVP
ncbi:unnamed protein product [marine sediment metagenome]|uniref:Uncharacterized protein n=1 Tax=marine sediment metagenome TaxID=412755 RepID=X0SHD9_9ZZZZ